MINANESRTLSYGYTPGENDVLCGRGAKCFNHIGNKQFRMIVEQNLDIYINTTSKYEKSIIISHIVGIIRRNCGEGGFIKVDLKTGQYVEVGDFLAREKTSQAFRDAINNRNKLSRVSTNVQIKQVALEPKIEFIHPSLKTTNYTDQSIGMNTTSFCDFLANLEKQNNDMLEDNTEKIQCMINKVIPEACSSKVDEPIPALSLEYDVREISDNDSLSDLYQNLRSDIIADEEILNFFLEWQHETLVM